MPAWIDSALSVVLLINLARHGWAIWGSVGPISVAFITSTCMSICKTMLTFTAMIEAHVAACGATFWFASAISASAGPGSLHWILSHSFFCWMIGYGYELAWPYFFSNQDELITLAQIRCISALYRHGLCVLLWGRLGASSLLTNRFVKVRSERHIAELHRYPRREICLFVVRVSVLLLYVCHHAITSTRRQVWPMIFSLAAALLPFSSDFLFLYRSSFRARKLWLSSYCGIHASPVPGDCEVHGSCSICWDNLCTSAEELVATRHRLTQHARSCLAVGRHVPFVRLALRPVGDGDSLGCPWPAQVATLRCGHKFHLECIQKSSEKQLQCPCCRASLDRDVKTHLDAFEELDFGEVVHALLHFLVASSLSWPKTGHLWIALHIHLQSTQWIASLIPSLNFFGLGVGLAEGA